MSCRKVVGSSSGLGCPEILPEQSLVLTEYPRVDNSNIQRLIGTSCWDEKEAKVERGWRRSLHRKVNTYSSVFKCINFKEGKTI